ncbi:MAG: MBOAT family protein [Clostridiales Family XIII bacterium]|nr:MBOAT family protein [Clostridiales Family XIII bacterium]
MPVGISFYTFQALSYTIDVYRGEVSVEKNLAKYALFVSFFPQLVAGPIERSKDLLPQIHQRHYFNFSRIKDGFLLMLWGYFEKMVIADRVAILVNTVYANWQNYVGFQIVIATFFFAIQIYCDFSGYSHIAKGAAQVLGFKLVDNFAEPYLATSIKDFWRRWHISLCTWLRDYVYIPLGGSHCSKIKKYRNVMITFLISGLWHGASWHFVVWGGLHGMYNVIGDALKSVRMKFLKLFHVRTEPISFKIGQILVTFIFVNLAWIFFRADNCQVAISLIKQMFKEFNIWILFDRTSIYQMGLDEIEFKIAVVSIIILYISNIISYVKPKTTIRIIIENQNLVFQYVFYMVAIFYILIFGIYGPEYNPASFIYFQF